MDDPQRKELEAYSRGGITALELRGRLDGATYGEVLQYLGDERLPLPRAPATGREEQIARARSWMFPRRDCADQGL